MLCLIWELAHMNLFYYRSNCDLGHENAGYLSNTCEVDFTQVT